MKNDPAGQSAQSLSLIRPRPVPVSLWAALVALVLALAIYSAYRPAATNVNLLLAQMLPDGVWHAIRLMPHHLHLSASLRDALPGGLWVFAATLIADGRSVRRRGWSLSLHHLPLLTALLVEILQSLHVTDGRFDPADMGAALLGSAAALPWRDSRRSLASPSLGRLLLIAASYAILPLGDVHP